MYRSGKDTVKIILLFNILIYLFSSRISPNLLTDLCTASRDGCYYSELDQQVSFGQIMFSPSNKIFPVRRCLQILLC